MDGIASKEGVIMLASTNRADVLDKVNFSFLRFRGTAETDDVVVDNVLFSSTNNLSISGLLCA